MSENVLSMLWSVQSFVWKSNNHNEVFLRPRARGELVNINILLFTTIQCLLFTSPSLALGISVLQFGELSVEPLGTEGSTL